MTDKQLIQNISKEQWIKRWAGSYTFISCSYWAPHYDNVLKKILGVGFNTSLFIHKKGTVTFLLKKQDLEKFGKTLAKKAEKDIEFAKDILRKLKDNTTEIMMIMQELNGKIPTFEEYKRFYEVFERHLAYHNFMKKAVDYMPKDVLDNLIDMFKDARLYSEPVYSRTELFFRKLAGAIAKKEKTAEKQGSAYTKELLTCLMQEELEEYLKSGELPDKDALKKRFDKSALFYDDGKLSLFLGSDVNDIEDAVMYKQAQKNEGDGILKGITAYPGKVKGICRIIPDPHDVAEFNEGEVLITGMTRPEFVPLMRKASAIVTDVGGVLCHAALAAREMKKPCIVGTEKATSFFQDGDLIEVDADKGMIKKIE